MIKTINDIVPDADDLRNLKYNYQPELTLKLDSVDSDFDEHIINEIVLWKINRYANLDSGLLKSINGIKKGDKQKGIDNDIIRKLLSVKWIALPVASTILRFKNPSTYQIIDQRVYRRIWCGELSSTEKNVDKLTILYSDYLAKLRDACEKFGIEFENADRIFYSMDKKYNPDEKLKGYSSKKI